MVTLARAHMKCFVYLLTVPAAEPRQPSPTLPPGLPGVQCAASSQCGNVYVPPAVPQASEYADVAPPRRPPPKPRVRYSPDSIRDDLIWYSIML